MPVRWGFYYLFSKCVCLKCFQLKQKHRLAFPDHFWPLKPETHPTTFDCIHWSFYLIYLCSWRHFGVFQFGIYFAGNLPFWCWHWIPKVCAYKKEIRLYNFQSKNRINLEGQSINQWVLQASLLPFSFFCSSQFDKEFFWDFAGHKLCWS